MKRFQKLTLALASALALSGCYEFTSKVTYWSEALEWTAAAPFTHCQGPFESVGIAGSEIWRFTPYGGAYTDVGEAYPLRDEHFAGYKYTLTSIAQTHRYGCDGDTLIHGNAIGQTDNLNLLHSSDSYLTSFESVPPKNRFVSWNSKTYEIIEVCDLVAQPVSTEGNLNDPNLHVFMSFRAKQGYPFSSFAGGVMEVDFSWVVDIHGGRWEWKPKKVGNTEYVWMDKPNGAVFSNECMPISVSRGGDQELNYLVLGDPSEDEISVFDASELHAGPFDSLKTSDSSYDIQDITVEGRRNGPDDFGVVAALWQSPSGNKLRHYVVVNEVMSNGSVLEENVDNSIDVLTSRGYGVESSSEYLYTFGDDVDRRRYEE